MLAGIGLLLAMMRKFKGVGMPLLGGVLSIAGVGVPILSTGGTSVAIDEASNRVAEVRRQVEQEHAQAAQTRKDEEARKKKEETEKICTVRFSIGADGTVSNLKLEKSSGDPNFDGSVLAAIRTSSPLPPPPEKLRDRFSDVRINFNSSQ